MTPKERSAPASSAKTSFSLGDSSPLYKSRLNAWKRPSRLPIAAMKRQLDEEGNQDELVQAESLFHLSRTLA